MNTNHLLKCFVNKIIVSSSENKEIDYSDINENEDTAALVWQFLLTIGDEVYKNREYILNFLEKQPNGEEIFNYLMNYLHYFERLASTKRTPIFFDKYPKTIKEAKNYFSLKRGVI